MTYRAPNRLDFQRETLLRVWELIADVAEERIRDVTPSRALGDGIQVLLESGAFNQGFVSGGVEYSHYWAVMLHDGHGPITPKNGQWLVYYANPDNDPRISPTPDGYPTRVSQRRFLTASDWKKINQENAKRRAAGFPPFAYIVRKSGPFEGFHWLEPETPPPLGVGRISDDVGAEASALFSREVLRRLPKPTARSRTATLRLR